MAKFGGTISVESVKKLISTGHCVVAYPRKGYIVVDGGKYFKATPASVAAVVACNKAYHVK